MWMITWTKKTSLTNIFKWILFLSFFFLQINYFGLKLRVGSGVEETAALVSHLPNLCAGTEEKACKIRWFQSKTCGRRETHPTIWLFCPYKRRGPPAYKKDAEIRQRCAQ